MGSLVSGSAFNDSDPIFRIQRELTLRTLSSRLRAVEGQTGKCGIAGDEGGHLIAASLGGAGDKINLVPQASVLNRGDWRAMENQLRNALSDGKKVSIRIDLGYSSGSARPTEFKVLATIEGKVIPY